MSRFTLIFFVGLFLLYLPAINGPYVLDDSHTIQSNTAIQSPQNLLKVWTSGRYYSSQPSNWGYRPLTTTSNALLWWVGGGKTWPFHLFKILIFAAIIVLLVRIWRRFLPNMGRYLEIAALLFAVNPVHSQVVCYIAATSSLLAWTCALASLHFFLNYYEASRLKPLILSLLFYLVAMMAKEEGVVAIFLIGISYAYLRMKERKSVFDRTAGLLAVSYAIIMAVGVGLIFSMFEPTSDIARGRVTRLNYFMTQWQAYLRYLALLLVPYDLNADNLEFGFVNGMKDWKPWVALVANVSLVGGAFYWFKRQPLFLFCLLWFYGAISPSSSVVVLAEPVNDHRALGGYFGLFGIIALAVHQLFEWNPRAAKVVVGSIIIFYSGTTVSRAFVWSSNEALWADTFKKNPSSPRAANNLAVDYMGQARYKEALDVLEVCRTTGSLYAHCFINRAITLAALGRDIEATLEFERALEVDIDKISARVHYADFLSNRGFVSRPLELYRQADQFAQGRNLKCRMGLIWLTLSSGDIEQARKIWSEAITIHGHTPDLEALAGPLKVNLAGQGI